MTVNIPDFHASYLKEEALCIKALIETLTLNSGERTKIARHSADIIRECRDLAGHGSMFDAILQEYGLSTEEGVTLMRLVEALIRTADVDTAHYLIRDKLSGRDWKGHSGQSPAFIVNRATNGLTVSSAWVRATGGQDGKTLLSKLGDSVLYRAIRSAMSVMSRHFVLGQNIEDAQSRAVPLAETGYTFSYDMLGEAAHTWADAERYKASYTHAMTQIVKNATGAKVSENSGLSVKLSALHPRYEFAKKDSCVPHLVKALTDLALIAKDHNVGLSIDAEEADRLEISMSIAKALLESAELKGWDGLSIVVQAYQRRAPHILDFLLETARAAGSRFSIRLVKGAYWDSEIKRAQEMGLESYPVFTRKENTDVSYLACARKLLEADDIVYPQFATHNAASMAAILHMAGNRSSYEFQRLHGMGGVLHDQIMKNTAIRSRVYAPVGKHKDLLPYLVRRLLENGANSSFVNQFLNPKVPPESLASDPVETVLNHTSIPHPKIPAPRDILNGERLSASGLDPTQNATAQYLEALPQIYEPVKVRSIISGRQVGAKMIAVANPSNLTEIVGSYAVTTPSQLKTALKSAATSDWFITTTPKQRADCLRHAAQLFEDETDRFLTLCVKEAGKSWADAIAELREAIDFLEYYADRAEDPAQSDMKPLGVIACISPWNFPLAILLGPIAAALGAGNTVICKPAEQTPLIAAAAIELMHKAGIPKDALHLVLGSGATIGSALVSAPEVKGVCFTGSTKTAKVIARTLADTGRAMTPLIAETGGINAMIVDSTALIEQAVTDVVASSFQSAGQRCSACRFVCVQDDIADDFIDMLKGSMDVLKVGNPEQLKSDVGPIIDAAALENLQSYIEKKRAVWSVIGEATFETSGKATLNGHYLAPIAFEIPNIHALDGEQFGPILHLYRFKSGDFDKVVSEINALGYGLTFGLHSRIDSRAEKVSNMAQVGNLYVNRNQIGAVVGVQPFGGEGLSGTGPKAGGPYYLMRLSKSEAFLEQRSKTESRDIQPNMETIKQDIVLDNIISKSRDAFENKAFLLSKAHIISQLAKAFGETPEKAETYVKLHAELQEAIDLPGPTGETNTFRHVPRGVLLCIASTGDELEDFRLLKMQILKAIITGNVPLIFCSDQNQSKILEALDALITIKDNLHFLPKAFFENALLQDIDGVISNGGYSDFAAKQLVFRDGAILPVLSAFDTIDRFMLERTVTIDVSAAGGNATLLAL